MKIHVVILLAALLLTIPAFANDGIIAISPSVSTLGIGAEASGRLSPFFNARLGFHAFNATYTGTEGDIEYDIDLKLFSGLLLLDIYPFEGIFHISAGGVLNQNQADLTPVPTDFYTIGDITYPAFLVGNLNGSVDFNPIAPYIGIGRGNPFSSTSPWSVSFDLGVLYQGSANVDLTADGPITAIPGFQENLEKERLKIEDDIDDYMFYPVVSLAVSYAF